MDLNNELKDILNPGKTALLVWDVQKTNRPGFQVIRFLNY